MKSFLAAVVVAALLPQSTAAAQEPPDSTSNQRLAVTAYTGVADFIPGFMLARGPYATAGAAISGRITKRLDVELGIAFPVSGALEGSRIDAVYPWGQAGMTAAQVRESGSVDVMNTETRDTKMEGSLLARVRVPRWKRVAPALLAGVGWQSVRTAHTSQMARGTRESYRMETYAFAAQSHRDGFLTTGFEVGVPMTERLMFVPQMRVDLKMYGDADPDWVLRPTVGIRWRF
jgi:opacity protein-like surface antigen